MVMAALLVSQQMVAQKTIVSTFVDVQYNQQQQQYLCSTEEGNDWTTDSRTFLADGGLYVTDQMTLSSTFSINDKLASIVLRGTNIGRETYVDVLAVDASGNSETFDQGQMLYREFNDSATEMRITVVEPKLLEQSVLMLTFYGNNGTAGATISSITLQMAEESLGITIYNVGEQEYAVDVTESNKDDVLGDGTISFDPENSILTLNNASFGSPSASLYCSLPELTIFLIGQNTLYSSEFFINMVGYNIPLLTFNTDDDAPGSLRFVGAWAEEALFGGIAPTYLNDLELTQDGDDYILAKNYDLWVAGTQVTSLNIGNVLGDDKATVCYEPSTNVLTLNGAYISGSIETSDDLIVNLVGINYLNTRADAFVGRSQQSVPTLTFTTSRSVPGSLQWNVGDNGAFQQGFNEVYKDNLAQQGNGLLAVEPYMTYGLTVCGNVVTSLNRTNVLGQLNEDGVPTVQFDGKHTLVFNGAKITGRIDNSLDALTIHLKGENSLENKEFAVQAPLVSTEAGATLTFTKSLNDPGSLLLTDNSPSANFISGFDEDVLYEYGLRMEQAGVKSVAVSTFDPLAPIVREDGSGNTPTVGIDFSADVFGEVQLDNAIIDNVLFTLTNDGSGQGFDPDEPAGVVITTGVDEADVDAAMLLTPGSDEFAESFKGITFRLPAGTGLINFQYKADAGSTLKLRIGNASPYTFTSQTLSEETVPYSCIEPTLVFLYLANNESGSHEGGPRNVIRRWKGEVGHIKTSGLGVTSSSMVNNNSASNMQTGVRDEANIYSLPSSAINAAGNGIELSVVEIENEVAYGRGTKAPGNTIVKPITGLGNDLFATVEKSKILYVNLSESELMEFSLNREDGPMKGFGKNTLFYLPVGNDDGGEENVVVNGDCRQLVLDDIYSFLAPYDFLAHSTQMTRSYVPGRRSTLLLPFALTPSQASELGLFSAFSCIQDDKAVFLPVDKLDGTLANTPYMFVPDVVNIVVDNVVVKGFQLSTASLGSFVGTYEKIAWDKEQSDIYVLDSEEPDLFVKAKAGTVLPPFQAYLKTVGLSFEKLHYVVDDGTVGIDDAVREQGIAVDEWITVGGQRLSVKPVNSGVYIHNGKKVMLR